MTIRALLHEPPGFGVRQPSGAFDPSGRAKSGGGLPHSKTLPRGCLLPRFMVPMRNAGIVEALHEPARSYACEGVGLVRETRFARRLTPAATVQGPDARSKGLEAPHEM